MVKISALPAMTSPDGDDESPIVDDSAGSTKKMTLTQVKTWLQGLTGWITTAMVAAGAITNAKLNTAQGELGGEWDTWTPTETNITVGNGTRVARYQQVGKTVRGRYSLVLGSTSSVQNSPLLTLPVNAKSDYPNYSPVGDVIVLDNGSEIIGGQVYVVGSSPGNLYVRFNRIGAALSATSIKLDSTFPITEVTGDSMAISFEYEAE